MIRVGDGAGVASVRIEIPAGRVGDGAPVAASAPVRIVALGRRSGRAGGLVLSVDSSLPLRNGGHTLPLSEIAWESDRGVIPPGRFADAAGQVLLRNVTPRARIEEVQRFSYANRRILAPGTYTGQVTYTVALP